MSEISEKGHGLVFDFQSKTRFAYRSLINKNECGAVINRKLRAEQHAGKALVAYITELESLVHELALKLESEVAWQKEEFGKPFDNSLEKLIDRARAVLDT